MTDTTIAELFGKLGELSGTLVGLERRLDAIEEQMKALQIKQEALAERMASDRLELAKYSVKLNLIWVSAASALTYVINYLARSL